MTKLPMEWLRQADYDMDTAEFMFKGRRYFYAVFMCHLSIEKALKGLYHARLDETPPKTHNLVYLLKRMEIKPPEPIARFLVKLNEASVTTRYSEDLQTLQRDYASCVVEDILVKGKDALTWIKAQF